MKKYLLILFLCAPLYCQTPFLLSAGASFDFSNHQPSANTSVGIPIASIAGLPTYSFSTFESTIFKAPGQTSQALGIKTGILQVLWQTASKHTGAFVYTQYGIMKADIYTLGNLDGAAGLFFDIGGVITKDKYHVWLTPMFREVNLTSQQIKPVYGFQITSAFVKEQ